MLISKFKNCNVNDIITDIERRYKIELPNQYKLFLLKYNGGYTPKTKFKSGKISSDVRGFFGLGKVELSINAVELNEWTKMGIFPIACDSFGNYIGFNLRDAEKEGIYFFDHEKEYRGEYVAKDFKSFVSCCKSEKISEASKRSIKEREELLIAKGKGNVITDGLRSAWQAEIDKYSKMVQEELVID